MTELYRILYCSRSTVEVDADEIRRILAVSRRNNVRDAITGGLFFSGRCFAQVLEGPTKLIEQTFERIQGDERHGEVVVLDAGVVPSRDFSQWSMAFAGSLEASHVGQTILDAAFSGQTEAGDELLDLLRSVVVREEAWFASQAA